MGRRRRSEPVCTDDPSIEVTKGDASHLRGANALVAKDALGSGRGEARDQSIRSSIWAQAGAQKSRKSLLFLGRKFNVGEKGKAAGGVAQYDARLDTPGTEFGSKDLQKSREAVVKPADGAH
jgi:hypothetical protein